MKKLALVLTLALVLAFAAPVFANPFSDVPADHWSYDAISKLAADGIVTGNPDGTFTGKKSITRYEMAILVAKAVAASEAQADKVAAENAALIQKLAAEFSTELNALGVKVAALEKKVGNVKFTGDARLRYRFDKSDVKGTKTVVTNKYQGRVRLTATAAVNDKVTVVTRLVTADNNTDDNINFSGTGGNATVIADRAYVKYAGKSATVMAGRQGVFLGKGTLYDSSVDGISLAAPVGNYTATLTHGRVNDNDAGLGYQTDLDALQFDGVKLFDKLTLGFNVAQVQARRTPNAFGTNKDKAKFFAANFDYAINDKIGLFGEFIQSDINPAGNAGTKDKQGGVVGVSVKNVVNKTDLTLAYARLSQYSLLKGLSTLPGVIGVGGAGTVELYQVRLDSAVMANTNLYLEFDNAKNKSKKEKINRFETGLEFKF